MIRVRTLILGFTTVLLSSFALARVHPFGDAGLYAPPDHPDTIAANSTIPQEVRPILEAKCLDCHSDQTRTPFYGQLAPISWMLESHIIEGRDHLDFTRWDSYTPDQQQVLLSKIVQETKSNKMPIPGYRFLHAGSSITSDDLRLLTRWAHGADASASPADTPSATAGNAAAGRIVFEKRCTGCHSLEQNREGPNLRGLLHRPAGQFPNFVYSPALKNSHFTWDAASLDRWLTDPDAFLPGNNMDFHVSKPQERADLIQYFQESASKGLPTVQ